MENSYNQQSTDSYYYVDQENDMLIRKPYEYNPEDFGQGDAIGRNLIAYYTWNDYRFIKGIRKCFVLNGDYYQGFRYPNREGKGISRDHVSYALIALKIANDYTLNLLISGLKWRISDFASFTPDMWCWMKSLKGNKFWTSLYYMMEIPLTIINVLRNKYIYWRAGYKEEMDQFEWVAGNHNKNKIDNKWKKKLFQVYAMHNMAWQLKVMPESIAKRIMQKLVLKMVPRHNYWIKMLLGDFSMTKRQIYEYVLTTGDRPTTILNPAICRRDVHVIKEKYNKLDVDYLRKLWENILF